MVAGDPGGPKCTVSIAGPYAVRQQVRRALPLAAHRPSLKE
jgi:hypothetical protein